MGFMSRLVDRIDAKLDRPADQSVLTGDRNPGSEAMIEAESADQAVEAGKTVRRVRNRRRWRWHAGR
jgi:hypothetical protein